MFIWAYGPSRRMICLTTSVSTVDTPFIPALETSVRPKLSVAEQSRQARLKGYVGDPCPNCQSFTLVRNGTCLKCETCGGTTGCS